MNSIITKILLTILFLNLLGCTQKNVDPVVVLKLFQDIRNNLDSYRSVKDNFSSYISLNRELKRGNRTGKNLMLMNNWEKLNINTNLYSDIYNWHSFIFLFRIKYSDTIIAMEALSNRMVRDYDYRLDPLNIRDGKSYEIFELCKSSYSECTNEYQRRLSHKFSGFFASLDKLRNWKDDYISVGIPEERVIKVINEGEILKEKLKELESYFVYSD